MYKHQEINYNCPLKTISQRILIPDVLNLSFKGMHGEDAKMEGSKNSCPSSRQSISHHPKKIKQKIIISKSLHQSELIFLSGADQAHNLDYFASLLFLQPLLL